MALAIVGARLLDARSEVPLDGDTLVVGDDGRIAAIGRGRGIVPDGATVLDAAGGTVVPGLIDCHVHLGSAFETTDASLQRSYTESVASMLACGREFLGQGVTTVRDAGGATAGIRRLFASGEWPGPRLQVSCSPLSITGGHGDGMSPSGVDLDGDRPRVELPDGVADGVDAVRLAVRRNVRAGADWIKVMATGGVYSLMDGPDAVQYSVEELTAIVEEAARAGLRGTLAHSENAAGTKNALRAGITSIEHGDGLDEEAVELMLARDVPLVPTLHISYEMLKPQYLERGITPPWAEEKQRELLPAIRRWVGLAAERGVRFAMGTDGFRGSYLPGELALLVDHGLTPLRALEAATTSAARLLRIDAEVGTLEPGKVADLALLSFDPLAEPAAWADPTRMAVVIQGGRVVADRR
jgi:imidazolonepropionase-like amidohydrolase